MRIVMVGAGAVGGYLGGRLAEAGVDVAFVARGISMAADVVERSMKFIDEFPPSTAASMHRDIAASRPSELEEQSGSVVRLGEEIGVVTPSHEFLYKVLLPLERRMRSRKRL